MTNTSILTAIWMKPKRSTRAISCKKSRHRWRSYGVQEDRSLHKCCIAGGFDSGERRCATPNAPGTHVRKAEKPDKLCKWRALCTNTRNTPLSPANSWSLEEKGHGNLYASARDLPSLACRHAFILKLMHTILLLEGRYLFVHLCSLQPLSHLPQPPVF